MSESGQMPPCCAENYISHADTADTIFPGEGCHADSAFVKALSRFNHLFVCEFSVRMVRAMHLPILSNFIRYVIVICSQKQVTRIATGRVIALVQHPKSFWYWAMRQLPGDPMGRDNMMVNLDLPVALAASISLPFPTIIRAENLHLRPEMLRKRRGTTETRVMPVNKPKWFTFHMTAPVFVSCCNGGLFAATTVAKAVWGVVRGIIHGVNSPFLTLTTPPNDSTRCGGNFIGCYSFIIPQEYAS
jgi:hypothetical protein